MTDVRNILSVDVEDWFQVETFAGLIPREKWDTFELRVRRNMDALLTLFDRKKVGCTFFTLGWVAERQPDIVRAIARAGHEVASHGWSHTPLWKLEAAQFADEVRRSKQLLEELSGQTIAGYRAPTFSITRKTIWAVAALKQAGYQYDSSIFPVIHDRYGIPDAPLEIHRRDEGVWEIPLSVMQIGRYRLPVAGGGYFRLYPYAVTRRAVRSINAAGRPAVVYLHPWEFDPEQPRWPGVGLVSRFRHHNGIARNFQKLERLLDDFPFAAAADVIAARAGG